MDQLSTITLTASITSIVIAIVAATLYFVFSFKSSKKQRENAVELREKRIQKSLGSEGIPEDIVDKRRLSVVSMSSHLPKFNRAVGTDTLSQVEDVAMNHDFEMDHDVVDSDVSASKTSKKQPSFLVELFRPIYKKKWKWLLIFALFLLAGLLASAQSLVLGHIVDEAITPHIALMDPYSTEQDLSSLLFRLVAVYITCVLVKMSSLTVAVSMAASLVASLSASIRNTKAKSLLLLKYSSRLEFSEGELIEMGGGDDAVMEECLYQVCYNLPLCISYIFGAYLFGIIAGGIVAFVSLTMIIIAVTIGSRLAVGKATTTQMERTKEEAILVGQWKEIVALLYPLISSHHSQHRFWSRWKETNQVLKSVHEQANKSGYLIRVSAEMCVELVITTALMTMAVLAFYGKLSVGSIFALSNIIWEISPPVATLSEVVYKIVRAAGPWKRLAKLRQKSQVSLYETSPANDPLVKIDSVVVQYPGNDKGAPRPPALDNVTIDFKKGERIAIMGPSGSGKSTFIGLVNGFLSEFIKNGKIDFGGNVVTVWQETRLFKGTVLDNLLLGFPDVSYNSETAKQVLDPPSYSIPSMEQIQEACKAAQIHDLISKLPKGYFTLVGEAGDQAGEESQATLLSVGQRQRLSIARGLLHLLYTDTKEGNRILCFDEPTAALDEMSSAAIDKLIGHANPMIPDDVLVLSVTHDTSLALECSRLLIVVAGKVVADGSPKEILDRMDGRLDVSKL